MIWIALIFHYPKYCDSYKNYTINVIFNLNARPKIE
jgi:hypothetical protein